MMAEKTERDRKIEVAARAIATGKGFDPDQHAHYGEPARFGRGYLIPTMTFPMWSFYVSDATYAVDALEQDRTA